MARPYLAAAVLVFVAHTTYAWAQGASTVQDIARKPESSTPDRWKKFEGSSAEVSTYIGSGTFYTSGYYNRYASLAVFAKPSYSLGTPYKLALRARLYVEEELTSPDMPNYRRFYPYDPWFWLSADNLKTFERTICDTDRVLDRGTTLTRPLETRSATSVAPRPRSASTMREA